MRKAFLVGNAQNVIKKLSKLPGKMPENKVMRTCTEIEPNIVL